MQIPAKPGAGKGKRGTINGDGERGDGRKIIKRSKKKNDKHIEDVSDEESIFEGLEAGETSNKLKFKRKARDTNQGVYPRRPPDKNARDILYFNRKRTGYIFLNFWLSYFIFTFACVGGNLMLVLCSMIGGDRKNTLGYIAKELWHENTVFDKGAKREKYYNDCIKNFKVRITSKYCYIGCTVI